MTQTLPPSHLLRCILFNQPRGPNLACTMRGLVSGRPASMYDIWRETLAQRRRRITLARWNGAELAGWASARVRSGHRAWELDQLFADCAEVRFPGQESEAYFPQENAQHVMQELLERIVQQAGESSAERVFLRVPLGSPVFSAARRAGFFPGYQEVLLESRAERGPGSPSDSGSTPGDLWRDLLPEDHYSLFQLYYAATPQPVRTAVALTFDQWRDAQEPLDRRRSRVLKHNGRVVGWLGLSRCGQATAADAMVHPEFPQLWPDLAEQALRQEGPVRWLVPDYQEPALGSLVWRGFHDTARYLVMIKRVAVPVVRPAMAAVEA